MHQLPMLRTLKVHRELTKTKPGAAAAVTLTRTTQRSRWCRREEGDAVEAKGGPKINSGTSITTLNCALCRSPPYQSLFVVSPGIQGPVHLMTLSRIAIVVCSTQRVTKPRFHQYLL